MIRKIWLLRKTLNDDLDPVRYYYSYDYTLIEMTRRLPLDPMKAKRYVDNYVEKCITPQEPKKAL